MTFHNFAQFLHQLESKSSRLEMTHIVAKMYAQLDAQERKIASYLLQGSLVPQYQSLEFMVSTKMLLRALSLVDGDSGQEDLFGGVSKKGSDAEVLSLYKKLGDEGATAAQVVGDSPQALELTITQVYDALKTIAETSGGGSQEKKLRLLADLFEQVDGVSAQYIARIVIGKMRLGVGTKTILDGLSWTVTGDKSLSKSLEEAFQKQADAGVLAQQLVGATTQTEAEKALANIEVTVGVPLVPQLCQRLHTPEEIIEKLGEVFVEPKYDGLRIQIHVNKQNNSVQAYTRSLENVTHMFPELQAVLGAVTVDSVILDAEGIGYDKMTNTLLPFQQTITRKRKHGVEDTAHSVPIRFYVYDVMYLNGESLIDKELHERKDLLKDIFIENESIMCAPYIRTQDPKEIQRYHEAQLAEGLEGAVVKKVTAPYQSGRKGWYWVKIKERAGTQGKLSDTIDCVVLGYYAGKGKRTSFGLGALLVGVISPQQELVTISKIGTGMSDEMLQTLKEKLDDYAVERRPEILNVPKALQPDVWVSPSLVVEVAADEITESPLHTAGVALRFPRLLRIRTDKTWEQATTTEELSQITMG